MATEQQAKLEGEGEKNADFLENPRKFTSEV